MYDWVVRVPLILWSKNRIARGAARRLLVQLIDIAPTILEAAGLTPPTDFEAQSLWGSSKGREDHHAARGRGTPSSRATTSRPAPSSS